MVGETKDKRGNLIFITLTSVFGGIILKLSYYLFKVFKNSLRAVDSH